MSDTAPTPAPTHGQSWIWREGAFAPCAALPLADRGFRYGMAFFESLAVRGGAAEFLGEHLARLAAACAAHRWAVAPGELTRAGEALATLCGPGPAFVRLYVTAGEGGPATPVAAPQIYAFAEARSMAIPEPYRILAHPAPHLPLFGGLKTANYWANAAAFATAREAGADEALLFNPAGELVSACMANVFLEIDGQWVTPPAASGARRGVVREWVMRQRSIRERQVGRAEMEAVSGCFLTSSWHGVIPVVGLVALGVLGVLNSRPLGTTVAEALRAEFHAR